MIHPMWVEFMKTILPAVYSCDTNEDDDGPTCRVKIASVAAELTDLACAEYDKRDSPCR
jgi:hypothetical protein